MNRKSGWLVSAALIAFPNAAFAQGTDTPAQPTSPSPTEQASTEPQAQAAADTQGEIVITAQGRRQLLQTVPIAVTAVGGNDMKNSGATDIRQLNQLAPSLLVSSTGTEANGSARIRGIGTVGDNPGLESSVAVFIDGVYRSRSGIGLNELGEIDRVEVLRGPQGTLFGRNASAGLIHVISKRPSFEPEAYGEVTIGNYDLRRVSGGGTAGLTDTIAARLDAVYVSRDGFYDVVNAAQGTESTVNDRNRFFTRGQLLFEPNDALTVRLIGDYTHRNESCCGAVYVGFFETFDPTPGVPGDFQVRPPGAGGSPDGNRIIDVLTSLGGIFPSRDDPYRRDIAITPGTSYKGKTDDWGLSGQIDWDIGAAQLTSITAYRGYKSEQPGDIDYNNVDIWFRPDDGNAFRQFKTFTQELRLQGAAFNKKLDWLFGGYFANEDLHVRDNIIYASQYGAFASCRLVATINPNPVLRNPAAPGCLSATGIAVLGAPTGLGAAFPIIQAGLNRLSTVNNVGDEFSNYFQDSRNWALFTHNIFHVTDWFDVTVGLRYTNEKKDFSADFNNTNTICPVQQAFFSNFLAGGATPLPASLQPLAAGIVNLTCQGNNSSSLNALNLSDERKEDEWTGTGALSFKPMDGLLVYGSYSRGYKAGGFNLDRSALGQPIFAPNDPRQLLTGGFGTQNLQFDPEIVDAFEAGFKYTRPGFTLNVAGFHQIFSNFQLNTFNGSVFVVQNVNGCSADLGTTDSDASNATGACAEDDVRSGVVSSGVEIESFYRPVRELQLTAGATYANTRYRDDLVGRDTGSPLDTALFLLPGQNLSNAPKWAVTGSLTWTPRIPGTGLTGLVYADGRYTSSFNTGSDLFPEKLQDAFVLFNARLGVRAPDQRWSVELWAQNLFNKDYMQVAFNTPFQGSNSRAHVINFGSPSFATANQLFSAFLAEPRTFGITLRGRM